MPLRRCVCSTCSEISGETERSSSRGADSSTVTCLPSARAVAAISSPMKPPPTTVSPPAASNSARSQIASSALRSEATLSSPAGTPGRLRARAPVASTSVP